MDELESCIKECSIAWGVSVIAFNGEVDHIHLLIALRPQIAPSVFVNNLKTVTSRKIRKLFNEVLKEFYGSRKSLWSNSYCLITVGGAPIEVLRKYIENQNRPT